MPTRTAPTTRRAGGAREPRANRLPIIFAILVALAAAIAIAVTVAGEDAAVPVEDTAVEATVQGQPLPPFDQTLGDPAIGQPLPSFTGTGLDGQPYTIDPAQGPMIVTFLAHWCPACQSEVPRIVDWLAEGRNQDVEMRAVSTGFDRTRGNWPPSAWLEREGWTIPTLSDPTGALADAAGLRSYPYFVAVDADGQVVVRVSGVLTPEQFDALVQLAREGV